MSHSPKQRLILASSSPRRQELIQSLGLPYIIRVSDADETVEEKISPAELVEVLSLRKASTVLEMLEVSEKEGIIIGSDTVVVYQDEVLGKPVDEQDSFRMLKALQGSTHQVYSGVACVDAATGKQVVSHRVTNVKMKPMSDAQILRYIATGEPKDKAGSYAIQGIGATIVESIEGDYFTVVGLPLSLLSDLLLSFEIQVL
ncbi:Maf family protein [Paenibacillus alginolyticus]|uniref:dTTP/UTP pyrophosphatase n=1 Tax=Paenibacillus alginolyticus TaxID=59839 RepID=A0ABT4GDP3_9BACL|nr:Maf family protein [Paenibacillus alginolyticus]MCY9663770.1 Maf family protein [Paenibacillus alginolyticus]MCY9694281.1 Maf family protein [Paenibacillus alginolyticus]MEC0142831.1 Maf family protein [Paenibacillus alginolyticus]